MPAGTIEMVGGGGVSSGAATEPVKMDKKRGLSRIANAVFQKRHKTRRRPTREIPRFKCIVSRGLCRRFGDSGGPSFFRFQNKSLRCWESGARVSRRMSWIVSRGAGGEFGFLFGLVAWDAPGVGLRPRSRSHVVEIGEEFQENRGKLAGLRITRVRFLRGAGNGRSRAKMSDDKRRGAPTVRGIGFTLIVLVLLAM